MNTMRMTPQTQPFFNSGSTPRQDADGSIHGILKACFLRAGDRITSIVGTARVTAVVKSAVKWGDQYKITLMNGYTFSGYGAKQFEVVRPSMNRPGNGSGHNPYQAFVDTLL